ncbi:DUF4142 domain-containing protein [Aquisalinus flavus]|uniref:DUF4142 domain-containing protein n=1 Tax=Aquisalinus flavus TaxID=1526572 RepID=A0A8J2Y5P4_9PROT|nr:DUF4142 domain-containing protein [Aquisalinus flavus]MBD0427348.1 DUF4142 domain-containing protein [Aquisalinus flavus]UNE47153.1 DUF4142 domain-containing protein [Aquisalinus flavus]GGD00325.1 hypothetical protein GCM10011342_06630 [Aquisalinus flavus]
MKHKLKYLLPVLPAMLLALGACGDDYDDTNSADETDVSATEMAAGDVDDDNNLQDDTMQEDEADEGLGQTPPVNLAQDMASGPVGLITAAIQGGDMDAYVRNAAIGNMYEIEAGEIATARGNSPEIIQIGETVIREHRTLQSNLEAAVAGTEWEDALPADLDERRQGLIDNLNAAADMDFDAAFLHQQEAAHWEAITLHETCEARCDSDALATVAEEAQPVIRAHLEVIHDSLGAAVDGE